MSDSDTDTKQRYSELSFAVKAGFCIILFGISLIYIFGAIFIIPKFQYIFQDMLNGKPLPPLTALVIEYHWILASLSLVMMTLGVMLCIFVPAKNAVIGFSVLVVAAFIQITITGVALILPLIPVVRLYNG